MKKYTKLKNGINVLTYHKGGIIIMSYQIMPIKPKIGTLITNPVNKIRGSYMAKFSSKGLLVMAIILSLFVALSVYKFLDNVQVTSKGDATVVVAKVEILPNTPITAEMVEQINIPSQYLQPGAMSDINTVLGVGAKEHILVGEQITGRLVKLEGKDAGFAGIIPRDKRAVSVSVNDVTGVAGLVKPGDYVDVIITLAADKEDAISNMIFQNVLVLAADKNINHASKENGKNKDDKITTLTVAVTPDDATKLALAQTKGKVQFALRPYSAFNSGISLVETKTISSLTGVAPVYVAPVTYASVQREVPAPTVSQRIERQPEFRPNKSIAVVRGTQLQNVAVK